GTGPETRAQVDTREGESRDVDLKVDAPPETAPPPARPPPPAVGGGPAPAPQGDGHRPIAPGSLVARGVAAAHGRARGGHEATAEESDLEKSCIAKKCGVELHDQLSSAQTWGNVSTVFFVLAGVGVAGGFLALLTAPKAAKPPATGHIAPVIGLGGAGLRGSF